MTEAVEKEVTKKTVSLAEKQAKAEQMQRNVEQRKAKAQIAKIEEFPDEEYVPEEEPLEDASKGFTVTVPEKARHLIPGPNHLETLATWKQNQNQRNDPFRGFRPDKSDPYTWTFATKEMAERFKKAWCLAHDRRGTPKDVAAPPREAWEDSE